MSVTATYTADEMMAVEASRRLQNGNVCFVGIGLPSLAANLARATHAPDCVLIYESGTIGARPAELPLSIGDGELAETAMSVVSVPEMFGYWLQGERIDVGFLGAAQIDRHGNLNSTVIGEYDSPKVRLPGGGGAPEIATSVREVFVMLRHSPRSFVERLDFKTSVGDRVRVVVTDLGILEPEEDGELTLTHVHARDRAVAGRRGDRLEAPRRRGRAPDGGADGRRAARASLAANEGRRRMNDPPLLFPDYRSTALRAPDRPLVILPDRFRDLESPVYGHEDIGELDNDLTRQHEGEPQGERIVVAGRVLEEDGRPVRNALVEIWQTNAGGRYRHDGDQHPTPLDPNFTGAGRTLTDSDGRYEFITIKPGAYPWLNHPNAWRPAHIHFSLFGRAFSSRLVTQMYFPGDPLFGQDPIFNSVRDEAARQRMVASFDLRLTQPEWALGYRFDIVLRQTPFE